ncbi:MAG: anti-sigma F factor [Clostridia bacterium]|nr:anti-sigma F factor [Clostridia bacterium]
MNEMQLRIPAKSENELFARNTVAAFALPLNPSLSELSDIKTAVSEAVTNCIVHGYAGQEGWIEITCKIDGECLHIQISDSGKGISDIEQALTPFYTTLPGEERSGMGFTIMQTFMSTFTVQSRAGEGTVVTMSKDFGAKAEANAQ